MVQSYFKTAARKFWDCIKKMSRRFQVSLHVWRLFCSVFGPSLMFHPYPNRQKNWFSDSVTFGLKQAPCWNPVMPFCVVCISTCIHFYTSIHNRPTYQLTDILPYRGPIPKLKVWPNKLKVYSHIYWISWFKRRNLKSLKFYFLSS